MLSYIPLKGRESAGDERAHSRIASNTTAELRLNILPMFILCDLSPTILFTSNQVREVVGYALLMRGLEFYRRLKGINVPLLTLLGTDFYCFTTQQCLLLHAVGTDWNMKVIV